MKIKLSLILVFFVVLFYCCKKNSVAPLSQWTLDGVKYISDTTFFNNYDFWIQSEDTANDYVEIEFHQTPVTGSYNVIPFNSVTNLSEIGANECLISADFFSSACNCYNGNDARGSRD